MSKPDFVIGCDFSSGVDWTSIQINGEPLPAEKQKAVRRTPGTVSAEMTLTLLSDGAWDAFNKMHAFCNEQITKACLGRRHFREGGGIVEEMNDGPAGDSISFGGESYRCEKGVWLHQIGTVRKPGLPPSNRLRKFVWRKGQLAEVRTRGRTGHRSFQESIEAALQDQPNCAPAVARVTLEAQLVPPRDRERT